MTEHTITILTILKTITVLLGATFLVVTARAYMKHRVPSLLVFMLAILLITIGVVAEGIAFQLLSRAGSSNSSDAALNALDIAHVIEGVFMLAGYVVLVASLWIQRTRRVRERLEHEHDEDEGPPGTEPPA